MARILRQEIKDTIISDNQLAADFSDTIDVLMISLPQMLNRDNKKLTHYDNIIWLTNRLNKTADQILIEAKKEEDSKSTPPKIEATANNLKQQ